MGAGVIPFSVSDGNVRFLFHTTFSGRREGFLVDFGGGGKPGETYRQTAVREFVEETETMYFEDNLARARRTPGRLEADLARVDRLFDTTLEAHPDWCCRRAPGTKTPPKDWQTFFVEFPYRPVEEMNAAWERNEDQRFKKRRELFWVGATDLLTIYDRAPKRLWKRVRQLEGAPAIIRDIVNSRVEALSLPPL